MERHGTKCGGNEYITEVGTKLTTNGGRTSQLASENESKARPTSEKKRPEREREEANKSQAS